MVDDALATRRLHERDAFRDQIDAVRTALGCRITEALETEDIVALLRAAGVTGSMVDAVQQIRETYRARAAAEIAVALWLAAPARVPIHEAHRLRMLGLVRVLAVPDTRGVRLTALGLEEIDHG